MRNAILRAAKQEFARQGFQKASMRKIASGAGIRVGNIYNYFGSKDELLQTVVAPAIAALDTIFLDDSFLVGGCEGSALSGDATESNTLLFHSNRVAMKILLFATQGSSLENFKSDYTNRITEAVKDRISLISTQPQISHFSIHLLCVWHFTLIEEMLMHNVKASEIKRILNDWKSAKLLLTSLSEQRAHLNQI